MKRLHSTELIVAACLLAGSTVAHADTSAIDTATRKFDRPSQVYQRDNTGINERDRDARRFTADQQSNEENSLRVTKQIRQAIVERDDLSSYAHNVKIIANDGGLVTLRGPVRNEKERVLLGQIAMDIAGRDLVKNELEVAPEKRNS